MWWKRDNDLLCTDFPGLALTLVASLSLCVCVREREQAGLGGEGGQFTNTCPHMSLKTGTQKHETDENLHSCQWTGFAKPSR